MEFFLNAALPRYVRSTSGNQAMGQVYELGSQVSLAFSGMYADKLVVISLEAETRKISAVRLIPLTERVTLGKFLGGCYLSLELVQRAALLLESEELLQNSADEIFRASLRR
jgi:hypothetical protein